MRKIKNTETVIGRLYQHNLTEQTSKKGVPYIRGKVEIAVDKTGMNVIPVEYTYVSEYYDAEKTKVNKNYGVLKDIIDNGKTWIENGPEEAMLLKCDTSLDVNNFVGRDDKMVESMRNAGGFISKISLDKVPAQDDKRKAFSVDIVINQVVHQDEDDETGMPERALVKGRIFNYNGSMAMPVELIVLRKDGMEYFESLEASNSNPIFTNVRGTIDSTVIKTTRTIESAFGEADVEEVEKKTKAWVIQAANPTTYGFDEDSEDLTPAELTAALQGYETHLAEVKASNDEYLASKNAGSIPAPVAKSAAAPVAKGNFDF